MILAQMSQVNSVVAIIPAILMFGVGIFLLVFWIKMIVECATREPSEGNTKIIWILIILLTHWIGALIYYFARRPQRIREVGR